MRTLRTLVGLVVTGLLVVAGAGSAQAHDSLVSSDPADGTTVPMAPEAITLEFSATAMAVGTRLVVLTPDGRDAADGPAQVVDRTITQPLGGTLPAGEYTVQWRVTSSDGHPVEGTFRFTAAEAGGEPDEPTAEPTTAEPTQEPTQEPTAPEPSGQDAEPSPLPAIDPGPRGGGPAAVVIGALFALVAAAAVLAVVAARRRRP